jgi:Co/Zn/Cd efflux system component
LEIHDFHVWQLSDTFVIGSVHVVLKEKVDDSMNVLSDIKNTVDESIILVERFWN